jgi:tRNA(Arg) A34 adenosine deaminase TadA
MTNPPLAAMRTLDHERFMREAIARARNVPQLPFGAVIVRAEKAEIVADGFNRSRISPTYHGEVDAINRCAQRNPDIDWSGLVLYTTAEPCPMCQSAVAWAGIGMVVFGSSIPFLQSLGWWQIDIRAEEVIRRTPFRQCVLLGGVLEKECNALFQAISPPASLREK